MAVRYRIGEFAELSGVSTKTLRFYDEIGLLRPAAVDPRTRYRLYLPQQLEELASILALKDVGASLTEVRNLTNKAGSNQERREILGELKKEVEQSIQMATQSLKWIDATLDELEDFERPIAVVVKRRPAVLVASIRSKVQSYSEIERFEQELLSELPVQSLGDLRGVLWHSCADSGFLEGEPFVALKQRVPSRSVYDLKQLPPATLACAYSGLDFESAERSYAAIRRWMNTRGYRVAGPKRELYLDGLLEIQFPMRSA
jgi:DNA-binding transcriptional MerR regulator